MKIKQWCQYKSGGEEAMYEMLFAWGKYEIAYSETDPISDKRRRPDLGRQFPWTGPWKVSVTFYKSDDNDKHYIIGWVDSVQAAKALVNWHYAQGQK